MGNISKLTPILYNKGETNFNHNGLGKLKKLLANEIDEVLNGEFEAFFEYPANGHLADKIDNEMYIKAKPNKKEEPHVFKVYDYELDTFTQTYLIYARSKNIEDLRNNVVLDVNVRDLAPTQAWNLAKNNALDPVVTTFYSDITTTSSVHWERRSLLSIIAGQEGSMIQYWGGEIKHDINRISLLRRRGQDNVTTVRHGKNLDGLKATYSTKGLVTAIVPYYVKDDDKAVYGDVVESEYINNYPSTYYDIIEYNDEELGLTQEDEPESGWEDSTIRTELNRVAKRYFDENVGKDLPSINMEISLEDISQTKEYENFKDFEQIEIGDTITVYSKKFDLNINAKVRRVVYNGLTDKNELVEVGTARRSLYDDVRDEFKKVETELKEGIDHAMASADGKNTIYHGTADPNEVGLVGKNNDTYFRANGQFKEIWSYLDGQWHLEVGDLTGEQIKADIAEQQQAIEEAKKTADEAVDRINTDIAGKFTALDEEILAIEGISNSAQANAQTALTQSIDALGDASLALTNAQTAINTAGSAISSIQDINVEVDKINGTLAVKADSSTVNALDGTVSNLSTEVGIIAGELSLKANSSTVDTLTGRVSTAESGITANANAIKLKANQSTVDTLAGTVSSLGTDIGIVAGQISSKVWNTDIETAVDRIEVGGRNLYINNESSIERSGAGIYVFNHAETPYGFYAVGDKAITNKIKIKDVVTGNGFYTVSFDLRGSQNGGGVVYVNICGQGRQTIRTPSDNDWGRFSLTVNVTNYDTESGVNYVEFTPGWAYIWVNKIKIEKGNKATDWTPAPEDTTALINHVESELTQKYDTIAASVSSVDGRVAQQKLTLDGTVTRVGNAEGKITTIESNVSGLQTTVASKAAQSQVTQLATGLSSVVKDLGDLEIGGRNLLPQSGNFTGTPSSFWFNNGGGLTFDSSITYNGYGTIRTSVGVGIGGEWLKLENGVEYTYSALMKSEVAFEGNGNVPLHYHSGNNNQNQGKITIVDYMTSYTSQDIGKFKKLWITFRLISDADSFRVFLYWPGVNRNVNIAYLKLEKGNKATDWTPAPEDTQSQMSQLSDNINLRVKKGDVVSQLNIDAGRTLISSSKILLNANTVSISGTAWMSGAVIANASIDGAKIQDATIGSAKIASLDVSKISGNKAEFITASFNGINSSTQIDADGIYMAGSGAWRRTYLSSTGFRLYNAGINKSGAIGYFKEHLSNTTSSEDYMADVKDTKHYIGIGVNATHHMAFGYQSDTSISRRYAKALQIDGDTGLVRLYRNLASGNSSYGLNLRGYNANGLYGTSWERANSGILFNIDGTYIWDNFAKAWDRYNMTTRQKMGFYGNSGIQVNTSNKNMEIWAGGQAIRFCVGYNDLRFQVGGGSIQVYTDMGMNGNNIIGQSDERLKTNIRPREELIINKLKQFNFVDFDWIKSGKNSFGLIAQQVQKFAPELVDTDGTNMLTLNNTLLNMYTTKSVVEVNQKIDGLLELQQELILRELNTNQVASQALQLVESIKSEIDELREENRDLRNRIEELESVT